MSPKKSREDIANEEVGKTKISPRQSLLMVLFFLATIVFVFITQISSLPLSIFFPILQGAQYKNGFEQVKETNIKILQGIDSFERELEENSIIRRFSLYPLQRFMITLGKGNEKVVIGKDGWLYYRPDIDALLGNSFLDITHHQRRKQSHKLWETALHPDPLEAIIHFRDQLALRNIQLFIVIAPIKPPYTRKKNLNKIHGFYNRGFPLFLKELDKAGVKYFNPLPNLTETSYLYTDTHWQPKAMEITAKSVAERIRDISNINNAGEDFSFDLNKVTVSGEGDIQRMLRLDAKNKKNPYSFQEVTLQQILQQGSFWQPQKDAEVLLLGDSFTNIYSKKDLGWGESAGFAEQLSRFLQRPIDVISRNDNGAFITRQMLAAELLQGNNRLDKKKIVIWEFSARELFFGDWRCIDLPVKGERKKDSAALGFIALDDEEHRVVTATVQAISASPRPGSAPYRNNLVTLHLIDINKTNDSIGEEALVYALGMKNNKLTKISSLRRGEQVKIRLSSWESVKGEYGSIRRSALDDEILELEIPNWGELIE